ncbi:MAG: S8 family serine peptidase [Hyphomicrobiaceae bacterium]
MSSHVLWASRALVLSGLVALVALAAPRPAEAQFTLQPSTSDRGKPSTGGRSISPGVPNVIIRGAIGTLARPGEEDGTRKPRRRPPTGKLTEEKKPAKPRCGVRGRPPCPDKSAEDKKPTCGVRGRPPCPGKTARIPPLIVLPDPGPGDAGPPPRAYGKREERAPQGRAAAPNLSVPRQVLVLVSASQPGTAESQIARTHRLRLVSSTDVPLLEARAQVYRIDDQRPVQAVIAALSSDPRVMMVQRNMVYRRQSGAGGAARAAQYGLDMIGAPSAHELATGRGIKIAVIDSGIDQDHRDLQGAVGEAFDATGTKDAKPDVHGTAIAGIIRARGLVSGVAPDATLLAARAFFAVPRRDLPESTSFIVLRALDWSVQRGAQVINLSFSGARDPVIERALAAAARRNVILVAAAGNGGPKAAPAYPAAYPEVIAVTAHDSADRLYAHANQGAYISLAAPGVDILVPALKNGHMFMSGTSMAAAYVSGIIALMLERTPQLRPEDALRVLSETAADLGRAGRDEAFGAGRVHARAALDALLDQAKAVGARQ